jgi:hypothetical protein
VRDHAVTLLASAVRTSSATGSYVNTISGKPHGALGDRCRVTLDVTAVSGTTPSLVVRVQALIGGVNVTIHTFSAITAVGQLTAVLDAVPEELRGDYSISGTSPSFTFSLSAQRI